MSGSDVIDPWPISAPALRMVILPSGAMRTHGVTLALARALACACDIRRTPSLPTAMQKVSPPRPASTLRRGGGVSIIVMAPASLAARWVAAVVGGVGPPPPQFPCLWGAISGAGGVGVVVGR